MLRIRVASILRAGLWLAGVMLMAAAKPSLALPVYARQYGVPCSTCHVTPPALNNFGLAFKANFYNWPGKNGPTPKKLGRFFPVSGIAEFSYEKSFTENHSTAAFRELELFASNGFQVNGKYRGGFFVNTAAWVSEDDEQNGGIENAFISFPFAGKTGQFAVTAGQFIPFGNQWNPLTSLNDSMPSTLEDSIFSRSSGGVVADDYSFSFLGAVPGVRIDYFDRRGADTADGNYFTLGVPFRGSLAFNSSSDLGGANGIFAHAFRRWGWSSVGAFAYTNAGQHLEGLMATHALRQDLRLMAIGAIGHDRQGSTRRMALEAEYLPSAYLAFASRLELTGGSRSDLAPVFSVTYYPARQHYVRLSGELIERKGDRAFMLIGRGQF